MPRPTPHKTTNLNNFQPKQQVFQNIPQTYIIYDVDEHF